MNLSWVSAAARWKLTGPAGPEVDMLVGVLIDAGLHVESITPGTAYRVDGDAERLQAIGAQLAELPDSTLVLQPEPVPSDGVRLRTRVLPARAYRRVVFLHGTGDAFSHVARAVDCELDVQAAGRCRWAVRGRTAALLAWAAQHVYCAPVEDVLASWNLTAADAQAEDSDAPPAPVVHVTLPTRRETQIQSIERDGSGQIVKVTSRTQELDDDE